MTLSLVLLFVQARINDQATIRSLLEYLKDLAIMIVPSTMPLSLIHFFLRYNKI